MTTRKRSLLLLPALLFTLGQGCGRGSITETVATVRDRDISGIAGPGDPTRVTPITYVPRDSFGSDNSADALGYPGLPPAGRALMDNADPESPLHFFTTLHTDEEGVGPQFNQRRCLGCHLNSDDVGANRVPPSPPASLNVVSTPVSRAARQGVTEYAFVHDNLRPNTAAFTLFGDYFPASGQFDPISLLGGPLQHVVTTGVDRGCKSLELPPLSRDPILQGGIDPVTGLSPLGARRETGERAGPPYIGRGLMEAIYWEDLLRNEDPDDRQGSSSTLAPQPDPAICAGDCISGRHNENRADTSIAGGEPVVRVSRFGLRAAGPTMLQFVVGGTQGEIGMTSPFLSLEQNNVINVERGCDQISDPEISADTVINLRAMIRLFGVPGHAPELLQDPPQSDLARDVQAGARLFGVDLDAFRSRVQPRATPVKLGDPDADRGIAADRQLNCVGCHIPIQRTGTSPAAIGAELLSNKWAPLFSDLLIHKMTSYPGGPQSRLRPTPPPGLDRNLADFAIPPSVTGIATGEEWRTPPLMGLGKVGPPFLHDARVFLNITGRKIPVPEPAQFPADRGVDPAVQAPVARTTFTSASAVNGPLLVDSLDHALQAAIELHDLPAPPLGADGKPDYAMCPKVPEEQDICSRGSRHRSEARNSMERYRQLTDAQQRQVIKFLQSL